MAIRCVAVCALALVALLQFTTVDSCPQYGCGYCGGGHPGYGSRDNDIAIKLGLDTEKEYHNYGCGCFHPSCGCGYGHPGYGYYEEEPVLKLKLGTESDYEPHGYGYGYGCCYQPCYC